MIGVGLLDLIGGEQIVELVEIKADDRSAIEDPDESGRHAALPHRLGKLAGQPLTLAAGHTVQQESRLERDVPRSSAVHQFHACNPPVEALP